MWLSLSSESFWKFTEYHHNGFSICVNFKDKQKGLDQLYSVVWVSWLQTQKYDAPLSW
jgi:hypothetical protein